MRVLTGISTDEVVVEASTAGVDDVVDVCILDSEADVSIAFVSAALLGVLSLPNANRLAPPNKSFAPADKILVVSTTPSRNALVLYPG